MYIAGMDLSGPSNTKETSVVSFRKEADGKLLFHRFVPDRTDENIYCLVNAFALDSDVVIGIDAPLSYNPGVGDRSGDRKLRQQITGLGMKSGSVMTPTIAQIDWQFSLSLQSIPYNH
jgi:predicted nuclease with RNAse H fold